MIFAPVFSMLKSLVKGGPSLLERQQRITFLLYASALIVGITANLAGLTGPQSVLLRMFNAAFMAVTLLLLLLYKSRRLSLQRAFCLMAVASHLFTCNEMVICAFSPSEYRMMLILGNMILLSANMMFALVAYMKNLSYVLGGMSMAAYVVCTCITGNSALKNFGVLYMILLLVVAVLGSLLVRSIRHLDKEHSIFRKEEEDMLYVLKMEREQVRAYIQLAKQRRKSVDAGRLLDLLGDDAQRNVILNVRDALTARELERTELSEVFPELTPSEIEICRFIIQDKTINEICTILKKTESNITCQRTNIRRKLGLKPADNLKKVLQARFNEKKNG